LDVHHLERRFRLGERYVATPAQFHGHDGRSAVPPVSIGLETVVIAIGFTIAIATTPAKFAEPWSQGTVECLETIELLLDLSPSETLKYKALIQLARIDRMAEMEERLGILFPKGHEEVHKLLQLVKAIPEVEPAAASDSTMSSDLEANETEVPATRGHVEWTPEQIKAFETALTFIRKIFGNEWVVRLRTHALQRRRN
jgi:hypothetical protein